MRSGVVTGADTIQPWAVGAGGAETRASSTLEPWRRFYSEQAWSWAPSTQGRGWCALQGPLPGDRYQAGSPAGS